MRRRKRARRSASDPRFDDVVLCVVCNVPGCAVKGNVGLISRGDDPHDLQHVCEHARAVLSGWRLHEIAKGPRYHTLTIEPEETPRAPS